MAHVVNAAESVKLRSGVNGLNVLWVANVTLAKPKKALVDYVVPNDVFVCRLVSGEIGKLVSMKESVPPDKLRWKIAHPVADNELAHAQITVVGVNGPVVKRRMECVCRMKCKAKAVALVDRPANESAAIFVNGALGENAKTQVMSARPARHKINPVALVRHKQEYAQMTVSGEIGGSVKQALAHLGMSRLVNVDFVAHKPVVVQVNVAGGIGNLVPVAEYVHPVRT